MKTLSTSFLVLGTLLMTACSAPMAMSSQNRSDFPKAERSYLDSLPSYQVSQVSLLQLGQHKDQVRQILGNPHFNEGVFAPKVWNYALGLQVQQNGAYENCRLRIDFDKNDRVQALTWKDQICADTVYKSPKE